MKFAGAESGREAIHLIHQLRQCPPPARRGFLIQFLREQFGPPLGIELPQIGPRDNLLDLGVDSLKAVEFKSLLEPQLGLQLSSSLLFDYSNLYTLAEFLLAQLGLLPQESSLSGPREPQPLPELSTEQVSELLATELKELNSFEEGQNK